MKLIIKHKETEVIIDDGYSDKYRAVFQYDDATKRLKETIKTK